MTRQDIELAVYRYLNKATSSPDSATQTRIRSFVNQTIREVLSVPSLAPLRRTTATVASVANQEAVGLPLEFVKIDHVMDRTNDIFLKAKPLGWLREVLPDPSASTSTPYAWVPYGYQAVQLQPSNASELFVKSSGADTTQTARIEGFVTGGLPRIASVTLNGTTAVSLSASITTWERVTKFYVSAVGVGVISLHEDSGSGTTLAQIPIGFTSSRYQAIRLWPTPASAITYHLDGLAALTDLAQDTDSQPCPEDFHELFVFGACYRECLKLDDSRAKDFKALYDAKVRDLKVFVNDFGSRRIIPGSASVGYSNLGPWFEADGYL